MIQLSPEMDEVLSTIVFEDKCVEDPAKKFKDDTLPALKRFHINSRKVLESVSSILQTALPKESRPSMAAKAVPISVRGYRTSFPITPSMDDVPGRAAIYERYEQLDGIAKERRVGGMLLATEDIRAWFAQFAAKVMEKL